MGEGDEWSGMRSQILDEDGAHHVISEVSGALERALRSVRR
jgi:hypothetical protein